jgi:hypothetical protein
MLDINIAIENKNYHLEKGYLDVNIDPSLDLEFEINQLKKKKMP